MRQLDENISLQASVFQTKIGWLVLAGYCAKGNHNRIVSRLLIGNATKREAIECWHHELETGYLSRMEFLNAPAEIRFTDWHPQCKQLLIDYAAGKEVDFSVIECGLDLLTDFQQQVLQATRTICSGGVLTYGQLADVVSRPKAARAIGATMSRNPVPIIIPCHRVIGSNGSLTGFTAPGGIGLKQKLLALEQADASCELSAI